MVVARLFHSHVTVLSRSFNGRLMVPMILAMTSGGSPAVLPPRGPRAVRQAPEALPLRNPIQRGRAACSRCGARRGFGGRPRAGKHEG